MLKFGLFCLGQAGNNIGEYAITKGFKVVAINSAKIDLELLKYIPNENKLHLKGYNGAGKDRYVGKESLINNYKEVSELIENKLSDCDCIFIAASGGGGTGSGALPIAIELLSEHYNTINIMFVLPDENESPKSQMNALECFSEISQFDNIGSVFIIDNHKALLQNKELSKKQMYRKINKEIIDLLSEINILTNVPSYTYNFDNKDFLEILNTRGCTLISKACMSNKNDITTDEITSNIRNSWSQSILNYEYNNILKSSILAIINEDISVKLNLNQIFNDEIPYDTKDAYYDPTKVDKDFDKTVVYTILSGLEFPLKRFNSISDKIKNMEEKLVDKFNKAQNQKLETFNYTSKFNSLNILNSNKTENKLSLSERISQYK